MVRQPIVSTLGGPLGPKTKALVQTLLELEKLLDDVGERHWSSWCAKARSRIEHSDFSGVEHWLSAYGGMGSINALCICEANGHSVDANAEKPINKGIRQRLERAYKLADDLKREAIR